MDHRLLGQDRQALRHQVRVLLHAQQGKGTELVFLAKRGAPEHVEHLQLHSVRGRAQRGQIAHRVQHLLPALSGQPEDHMDHHRKAEGLYPGIALLEHLQRIATADPPGAVLVDGLQAQLQPHGLDPLQPAQHGQNVLPQTVRPGAQGQSHDLLPGEGVSIQGL